MNINPIIMQLKTVTGYPVVPDLYMGDSDKWIVFTYEDERGALYGDNGEEYEQATVQITLYTPHNFNYMPDKKKIKKALIDRGFQLQSIRSWIEDDEKTGSYIRHTSFTVFYVTQDI